MDKPNMIQNENSNASNVSCDLTKLQIAQSLRDYHHKALWEEEKHFMWFVSIIMSVDVLLITTDKLDCTLKGFLILLASAIGAIVCLIALRVIRSESCNFQIALYRFIDEHNKCFSKKLGQVDPDKSNKSYAELFKDMIRGRVTIRDSFQLLFCLFFLLFLAVEAVLGFYMLQ
jgi:hypothetical protein